MFEPSENEYDADVHRSMNMFERARIGEVPPIEPRRPSKLLLVLDASNQDRMSRQIAERLRRRFDCELTVQDAREGEAGEELAQEAAASLDGRALPRAAGDSYEQILQGIEQAKCALLIVPCPYGRQLEKVGADSTGTVIDVLLSRSPVPLLVVRNECPLAEVPFARVQMPLWGENEAAANAAAWAAGLVAPSGCLELLLLLEKEAYENFSQLLREMQPDATVTYEEMSEALVRSHVRLHRALQKAAEAEGFSYSLQIHDELRTEPSAAPAAEEGPHGLLVLGLERADHASQGHVTDRIRMASDPLLIVPRDARPE